MDNCLELTRFMPRSYVKLYCAFVYLRNTSTVLFEKYKTNNNALILEPVFKISKFGAMFVAKFVVHFGSYVPTDHFLITCKLSKVTFAIFKC